MATMSTCSKRPGATGVVVGKIAEVGYGEGSRGIWRGGIKGGMCLVVVEQSVVGGLPCVCLATVCGTG